jgi:hypothetical protein
MWRIEKTDQMERDQKWYEKKRPNEFAAVMRNLERYLGLIKVSKNSKCAEAGYLHKEPGGIIAIDQKGFAGNLQETRLYTLADDAAQIIYLITIGNKSTQHSDVELSKQFAESLSKDLKTQ